MELSPDRFRSFFATRPLIIGILLASLGTLGLGYVLTRGAPVPATQIPPTELEGLPPDVQILPSPSPPETASTGGTLRRVVRVTEVEAPPPPEPPVVTLLSPASGATYIHGQPVTYEASVSTRGAPVRKVEFFAAATGGRGYSACNNSRDIELPATGFRKIGESSGAPYTVTSSDLSTGHYAIYAIVTDKEGIRQLSEPRVIFVENFAPDDYPLIKGWGSAYHNRKYQNFGTELYEHILSPEGRVWDLTSFTNRPDKACLNFSLAESRLPNKAILIQATINEEQNAGPVIYDWTLSGASIVEGQGTDKILVEGLTGSNAMATVVIRGANGCAVTGSLSLPSEEYLQVSTRVEFDSELADHLKIFAEELRQEPDSSGAVLVYGGKLRCRTEVEWMIKRAQIYLNKERIASDRVTFFPAGYRETRGMAFYTVPRGADLPVPDSAAEPFDPKSPPCSFAENLESVESSAPRFPYQKCPDIVETVNYKVNFSSSRERINICPFNPLDPQDESGSLKIDLGSQLTGIYGIDPVATYVTNGGEIAVDPLTSRRSIWDLTSVRYKPGYYTAAVDLNDACGCHAVATQSVVITNYCQPCLDAYTGNFCAIEGPQFSLALDVRDANGKTPDSLSYDWRVRPESEISSGNGTPKVLVTNLVDGTQGSVTVDIQGMRKLGGRARINVSASPLVAGAVLRYRWTVSQGTIVSGQDSDTIEVDLGRSASDTLQLKIDIDRLTEVTFSATSYEWSRIPGLYEDELKYNWKVDKGEIVRGQGTRTISVAGYLKEGTEVKATVEIDGLLEYCAKQIVVKGTATANCQKITPTLVDEFGNLGSGGSSPAKRKKRYVVIEEYYYEGGGSSGSEGENASDTPNPNGKEYMTVQWPNPVQVGEAITIKTIYDRQTGALELKNEAGEVVFALKRPIANYWGDAYEVWGRVGLQSASLFENGSACAPQCYAMPKPISSETQQIWTFSLTAKEAGTHAFNLELMIEGRHKFDQTRIDERPAWNAENLRIEVREDIPTHTQMLISSIILCTGGLGFCVRSLRLKAINIALFGGTNVAGDQVVVEGDQYNVENAAVVGRNVEIKNSNIEQRIAGPGENGDLK